MILLLRLFCFWHNQNTVYSRYLDEGLISNFSKGGLREGRDTRHLYPFNLSEIYFSYLGLHLRDIGEGGAYSKCNKTWNDLAYRSWDIAKHIRLIYYYVTELKVSPLLYFVSYLQTVQKSCVWYFNPNVLIVFYFIIYFVEYTWYGPPHHFNML